MVVFCEKKTLKGLSRNLEVPLVYQKLYSACWGVKGVLTWHIYKFFLPHYKKVQALNKKKVSNFFIFSTDSRSKWIHYVRKYGSATGTARFPCLLCNFAPVNGSTGQRSARQEYWTGDSACQLHGVLSRKQQQYLMQSTVEWVHNHEAGVWIFLCQV